MDAESVRRLIAYLGEKEHKITTELNPDSDGWMWSSCICGDRWSDHSIDKKHRSRPFDTPVDMQAVLDRMVELKQYEDFYMYATRAYKAHFLFLWKFVYEWAVSEWLFSHNEEGYRFLNLAATWLEEKEKQR